MLMMGLSTTRPPKEQVLVVRSLSIT